MKRFLILLVVLGAMMCITAFAADNTIDYIDQLASGVTVNGYEDDVNFELSYSGASNGGMYLLWVLRDELQGTELPTVGDVLYVNQATATSAGVAFDNVYPSEIEDNESYIYLSGPGGIVKLGRIVPNSTVPAAGLKGDVDLDEDVDMDDVIMLLRHVAEMTTITNAESLANSEVVGDDTLTMDDVIKLLRYVAEMIDSLD